MAHRKFQHARGVKSKLPKLAPGEIVKTTDTEEIYIGGESENIKLLNEHDVIEAVPKNFSVTPSKTTFASVDPRNIFDKDKATDGLRLDSSGKEFVDPQYTLSDFIDVENGNIYKVGFAVTGYDSYRICAYDKDKNFIKTLSSRSYGVQTISLNVDFDGFIRVPFQLTGKDIALVAKESDYDGFHPYKILGDEKFFANPMINSVGEEQILNETISPQKTTFVRHTKNQFNKNTALKDYTLNGTTGSSVKLNGYYLSDYIQVKSNQSYTLSNPRNVAFYNSDKSHLGSSSFINNSDNQTITITPIVDGYIRISLLESHLNTFQMELGANKTEYEDYGIMIPGLMVNATVDNKLKGKILLNFGDSIGAGSSGNSSYAEMIAIQNGMTFINKAAGGSTIAPREGYDNQIINQVNSALSDSTAADYILLNGLTNDANVTPEDRKGVISEGYESTLDLNTFAGSFENLVKTLIINWMGSKIIYIRPHNMSSRDSRQILYGDLAVDICKKWSIPFIDMYNEGGLNTHIPQMKRLYTLDTYNTGLGDGTHPNQEGYGKFYVPRIESKMRNV